MNHLDSYDCSDFNDNLDSQAMNASTVYVYNNLPKHEAPLEPIPSIASSLMRTVELFFLLIIGMYLFSATLGLIMLGIENLLSVFLIIWNF